MKKKLFLIVIAVLVVALMCGVLLVACDDNNDPPTPPPPAGDGYPYTENVGTVLGMIIDNLDAEAKADNGEIAVAMELKSEGKVLFGLAFEELKGEQIMYAALNSNVYAKFNGFNLGEVVESALGLITNPDGSLNIPGVDLSKVLNGALANIKLNAESVKSLIELIVTFGILAENGVVHDANEEVLTVSLDLASIVGLVGGFVKSDTIAGAVGIYKQDKDGNYIDAEGKPTTDPAKYVADGAVIDKYINQYAPIILPELPKVDGNYTGGLSGIFTYIAGLAAQAQFDITFATGDIVRDDTQNPFIGTSVGTARDKQAVNLLTFNVDAEIETYTPATSGVEGTGEDQKTTVELGGDKVIYDITIDGSLDPFVAIELLYHYIASVKAGNGKQDLQDEYWDKNFPDVMKSMLSKVGYLQITVDEYAIKGESREFTNNILTLSFNSDQGYILANANIHAAADNELDKYDDDGWISLGGTYDMDTFVDYLICVMEGGKIGAGAAADGEVSIIDTIIEYIPTILELVKKNAVITGEELDGEVIADGVALNLGALVDGAFDMILGGLETTDKDWLNTWDGFVKALVSADIDEDGNIVFGMLNEIQGIEIKFEDWSAAFGNAQFRDLTKLDAYKGIVSEIVAGENAAVTESGDGVYTISGKFTVTKLDGTTATVEAKDLVLIAAEEVLGADGKPDKVIAFVASPSEITKALAGWEGQTQKVVYPFSGMHAIEFEVKA